MDRTDPSPSAAQRFDRLILLDVLRGLAALSVVVWHWQHFWFGPLGQPTQSFDPGRQPFFFLLRPIYALGWIAVDLFFLLSGFIFFWKYASVIADREISGRIFFVRRFARLYPLHFATLIATAGLQLLYLEKNGHSFVYLYNDLYHFTLNIFLASHWGMQRGFSFNGPVWSLSLEIVLYTVFFFLALSRTRRWWHLGLLCVLGAFLYRRFDLDIGRGLLCFFLGGLVFYAASSRLASASPTKLVLASAAAMVAGFAIAGLAYAYLRHPYYYYFALVVIAFPSLMLLLVAIERRVSASSLAWFGDISYSTYLLHFPLQMVAILVANGDSALFSSPIVFFLFFAVLIGLARMSHNQFERPLQDMLIRRFGRPVRASSPVPS